MVVKNNIGRGTQIRTVRKITRDQRAQSSLFDALMFFVLMMIASSLIFIYSTLLSQNQDISEREEMRIYGENTRDVIMDATLNETWYEDINGDKIRKPPGDTTIRNLILEEMFLMNSGVPRENFMLGYEKDIKMTFDKLIRSGYHYAIHAVLSKEGELGTCELLISDLTPEYESKDEAFNDDTNYHELIPRDNLIASQWSNPLVDMEGEVQVTFYIWR